VVEWNWALTRRAEPRRSLRRGEAFFFFRSGFGGDLDDILSGHGFGEEGKE